jgi:hypothetical protein
MGSDEYHPLTKKGSNLTDDGGIGYAVIDSIDTMQIMGLDKEYNTARNWIANELSFDRAGNFNTFETTIRVLGGLLTAYHLSNEDPIFLQKATELADRMMPAFDTPTGLPFGMVNLKKRQGVDDPSIAGLVSTAEASTLQLELKYLSFLTDDDNYWDKAEGVMKVIKAATLPDRLAPIYLRYLFSLFCPRQHNLILLPAPKQANSCSRRFVWVQEETRFTNTYCAFSYSSSILYPSYRPPFFFRKQYLQTVIMLPFSTLNVLQ